MSCVLEKKRHGGVPFVAKDLRTFFCGVNDKTNENKTRRDESGENSDGMIIPCRSGETQVLSR